MNIIQNSKKKGAYFRKDLHKFRQCNKLIARGSASSSSEAYRIAAGDAANCGEYVASDIVGLSIEGDRAGRVSYDYEELGRATQARATIIKDVDSDVARPYNVGERAAQVALAFAGYMQVKPGIWEPSHGFKPGCSKARQQWVYAAIKAVVDEENKKKIKFCSHCSKGKLEVVEENPPYSVEHLQCDSCDSTFGIDQEEWEANVTFMDVEASQESLDKLNS